MLQRSKLLPVVLLVGIFSASCAMPTTKKKTETVDVSDIDRAFSPSSFKISLSTTKKELAQQETLYENYVIKASNNSSLKSKLDNIKNMITKTKNDIVGYIFVARKPHELALCMNGNKLTVTENYTLKTCIFKLFNSSLLTNYIV